MSLWKCLAGIMGGGVVFLPSVRKRTDLFIDPPSGSQSDSGASASTLILKAIVQHHYRQTHCGVIPSSSEHLRPYAQSARHLQYAKRQMRNSIADIQTLTTGTASVKAALIAPQGSRVNPCRIVGQTSSIASNFTYDELCAGCSAIVPLCQMKIW